MTTAFEENLDRLDGLFAYDTGCVSSGIKDDSFKEHLSKTPEQLDKLLTALVVQYAKDDKYTFEDVVSLVKWAEANFGDS